MAEIKVERKKVGIWPWIIGLLVVALLVWLLVGLFDDRPPEVVGAAERGALEVLFGPWRRT